MPNTTTPLLLALVSALLCTTGHALAQQEASATTPQTTESLPEETTQTSQTEQMSTEEASSETPGASAPSAAAVSVAHWLRAIGGRISLGPKLTHQDRVSRPNLTDISQGWHVSTPGFAHARLSMPPARATTAKATSEDKTHSEEVELATESATDE